MDLENITLHVEEDKIIDTSFDNFDFFYNDATDMFELCAYSGISTPKLIASSLDGDKIEKLSVDCNQQLKSKLAECLTPWDFVQKFHPNYSVQVEQEPVAWAYEKAIQAFIEAYPDLVRS